MTIEEIMKKTIIKFPRPIGRKDSENLFCYLSGKLPANISGKVEYFKSFRYDEKNESVVEENGTLKLTATIYSLKDGTVCDYLESRPWDEDTSLISAIAFHMVPGWESSDYRPKVQKFWDQVRGLVNKYFEEVIKH